MMVKVTKKETQYKNTDSKFQDFKLPIRVKSLSENLDETKRHWRYVSDDNNVIIINRATSSADEAKLTHIDLKQRFVISPNNDAIDGELPKLTSLASFPHLCESIRAYAIELTNIHGASENTASVSIVKKIYSAIRFLYFISTRGKYHLANVTRTDLDAFLASAHSGWHSVLNLEDKFNTLIKNAKNNKELIATVTNVLGNDLSINDSAISMIFGFDVKNIKKPKSVYNFFIEKMGANKDKRNRGYISKEELYQSPKSIASILDVINGLRKLPSNVDRMPFLPFHDINLEAKNVSLKSTGRTENISLEDTVKLLDTSLKWMYDYSPHIFDILAKLKIKVIELHKQEHLAFAYRTELLGAFFRSLWNASPLKEMHLELNVSALNVNFKKGTTSFKEVIQTLQTSCFVVVAINNARRKNEIIGENKKYGLYYGCVNSHKDNILNYSSIDIYIEKTLQDYYQFWTNDLTVDAVELLEKLYLAFLPENSELPDTKNTSKNSLRNIKLFQIKSITPAAFNNNFSPYVYGDHSKLFFKLSGVNKKILEGKTHVFRRIFSLIYHYRYKNQKLHALSQHLRHRDFDMTRIYITDPYMRSSAERIEKLYKESYKENEAMDSIDSQVKHEFAIELVTDILMGNAAGGYTKRVKRLHNLLLNRTKIIRGGQRYKSLCKKEQIEILTDSIERHGNKPNSRNQGVCWADNQHKGACRNEITKKLERHIATPRLCVTCSYNQFSTEYIINLEDDYVTLSDKSKSYDISKAEQLGAKKAANNLKELIKIEKLMVKKAASV